jgi:hypothetical protein
MAYKDYPLVGEANGCVTYLHNIEYCVDSEQ